MTQTSKQLKNWVNQVSKDLNKLQTNTENIEGHIEQSFNSLKVRLTFIQSNLSMNIFNLRIISMKSGEN